MTLSHLYQDMDWNKKKILCQKIEKIAKKIYTINDIEILHGYYTLLNLFVSCQAWFFTKDTF